MRSARTPAPLLAVGLLLCAAGSAQDLRVTGLDMRPPPQRMLRAYLDGLASRQLEQRRAEVAKITSREQYEKRREYVRAKMLQMIGGLPIERPPLKLRRTGRLERGDYRVEKIIYESLPNFYVTANLYVPLKGQPPYPAVLHPTGHSVTAKNRAFYQSISIGLAKQGFVVLTYDPIGQGERRVFYDAVLHDSKVGASTTTEHSMVGIQSLLAGESVARYRIWDGIRSIDVLQLLPEVDGDRIGVTGCSGGGTLSVYLAAIDQRLKVAAPACYVTSWEEQLKDTGPQDAEQQFPDQLLAGVTHADMAAVFAPRPYLICSSTEDFFPLEGARQTYEEVRRIYSLFNAEERIAWFSEPGGHGIRQPGREQVYAWMKRWLRGDPDAKVMAEPPFQTEYEEDLNCTPTGQVATSLGGETASTWNVKRFEKISPARPPVKTPADLKTFQAALQEKVRSATRFEAVPVPLNLRSRGAIQRDGYRIERLLYDSGDGRYVPALLAQPDGARRGQPVIYVDQQGMAAGFASGGSAEELVKLGHAVLALDPAGVGETTSDWSYGASSAGWFGQEKVTWLALMVGKPLVGLRMTDILRGLDLLAERRLLGPESAIGFARGNAGVDLLHAAAMDSRISGVVVEECLLSYRSIATSPLHRHVFETVLPGVLDKYDVPDLVAALAPRPVWLVSLRSPVGKPVFRREIESAYGYAISAYRTAGTEPKLRFLLKRESDTVADLYPELR